MWNILLVLLLGVMFSASAQSQTASSGYAGPDFMKVDLSVQVVNGKNGVPLGQPGAQAWDVGPGNVPLPDIAFCVKVPGMPPWCTQGFAEGRAKPECRDNVSCRDSLLLPKSAQSFVISIKDMDLRQHDEIGQKECRMELGRCTVGAAVVTVWFQRSDMCPTANVNYELNIRTAEEWKRAVDRHNKLVDYWKKQGQERQAKLAKEVLGMVGSIARDRALEARQETLSSDTRTLLLEIRQALVEASKGEPLKPETRAQLRQLLDKTLKRAEAAGQLPAFQVLMRAIGPAKLAAELLLLFEPAYEVFEAEVADYDNQRITDYFSAWRANTAQKATSLAEEARRNGCPIQPALIQQYNAMMGGRATR